MKNLFIGLCVLGLFVVSATAQDEIVIDFNNYSEGVILGQKQGDLEWMNGNEEVEADSFVVNEGALELIQDASRNQWIYTQFESQDSSTMEVEWDWQFVGEPEDDIDVGFCLSDADNFTLGDNPNMTWNEQGGMVRMSEEGLLDVRFGNLEGGGDYTKDVDVVYNDGALIHMRMVINLEFQDYTVYAQREGEDEVVLAQDYLFRRGFVDGVDSLTLWQNANIVDEPMDEAKVVIDNIVIKGDFSGNYTPVTDWHLQ